ncbi:MAG: hypothetical protein OXH79_20765 [Boseongicola sp.]|nr:hypothetical protein [Boseongicola sp.]
MSYLTQVHDFGAAGVVPGPKITRPDLNVGVARMRETPVKKTGHSEFGPELSESGFEHVHSELSRRVHTVAAPAIEQVAT